MRKTQGNPFFATQFLKSLHQDQLIAFDRDAGIGNVILRESGMLL
jgi:predicted ATPase